MIAIVEKDKVTIANSANVFFGNGFCDTESLFAEDAFCWKVPNDSGIIVGASDVGTTSDFLRYDSELIYGELTKENLEKNVIPKIKKVLSNFGKLDEDGESDSTFYFAQGGRCFEVSTKFCCAEVQTTAETGPAESLVASYCEQHPEESMEERLKNGFTLSEKYYYNKLFPIATIDTEKQTVEFINAT